MNSVCQDMLRKAKEIMKKIINSGFEAYLVGSSVRNIALDQDFNRLEIFSTIPMDTFKKIFSEYFVEKIDDSHLSLGYLSHKYLISFLFQYPYQDKLKTHNTKKHYSKALIDFVSTKDYSIDAMSMSANNIIYDAFNGKEDMNRKRIRSIYAKPKYIYDNEPYKMLEVFKIISETGYKPDSLIIRSIRRRVKKIKNVPLDQIALLMKEIQTGKYFKKSLKYMYKSKIYKYLDYFKFALSRLHKNFRKEDLDSFMAMGLIKEKIYEEAIGKATDNEYDFRMLVNLAITNPKPDYDDITLFSCGLEKCMKANRINYLLGRCKKKGHYIKKKYNNLRVKKPCDLAFKGEDILKMADLSTDEVGLILDDIIYMVLDGQLENKYEPIKEKVIDKLNHLYDKNSVSEKNIIKGDSKPDNTNEPKKPYQEYTIQDESREQIVKERFNDKYDSSEEIKNFEIIKKRQDDLDKRLRDLENQGLYRELEMDIERKIRESGILNDIHPDAREETKKTLYRAYYDSLIKTEKYKSLNR